MSVADQLVTSTLTAAADVDMGTDADYDRDPAAYLAQLAGDGLCMITSGRKVDHSTLSEAIGDALVGILHLAAAANRANLIDDTIEDLIADAQRRAASEASAAAEDAQRRAAECVNRDA